jgi:hypothetical protein
MGLFDFLKSKSNDPLSSIHNNPSVRKMMIAAEVEALSATMSNLKSVGREAEAEKRAKEYLIALSSDCVSKYSESSEVLNALATSSISLGQAQLGKRLLEEIIKFHEEVTSANVKGAPALDLTQAYIDSGRLAHQIRESRDDEYRCYCHAITAAPPHGCKNSASIELKALAHNYAYLLCSVERRHQNGDWEDRMRWHDRMRRACLPYCEWDNPHAVIELMGNVHTSPGQNLSGFAAQQAFEMALDTPDESEKQTEGAAYCLDARGIPDPWTSSIPEYYENMHKIINDCPLGQRRPARRRFNYLTTEIVRNWNDFDSYFLVSDPSHKGCYGSSCVDLHFESNSATLMIDMIGVADNDARPSEFCEVIRQRFLHLKKEVRDARNHN